MEEEYQKIRSNNVDTQKEKKHSAIGLATLSALLGITAKGAHSYAKGLEASQVKHLEKFSRIPKQVKDLKMIRNVAGTGAVGAGVGSAILATKYYKNKKKVETRTPTDADMKKLLKGQPDAKGYKGG